VREHFEEKDLSSPFQTFLFQAVRELLFNVVKHGETGEAEVTLEAEDGHLKLCVQDDGKGFELASLKLEGGDSGGIGLLSLRERVSALGGRLEIESRPGEGSRFMITLALRPDSLSDSVQAPKSAAPSRKPSPAGTEPGDILRVLLADDHRVMRQGLVSLLTVEPDIEVVAEADNGLDALEKAEELKPDIVVMDVSMPVLDGIEATQRLRALMPEIAVIGLSMFEEGDIERKMLEAGASAYLAKSGPSALLLSAIRACRREERTARGKRQTRLQRAAEEQGVNPRE
jgi:CheY-like chemotaxis protein